MNARLHPAGETAATAPRDLLGRPLRDLRLSVIDACNFRCPYCMPADRIAEPPPTASPHSPPAATSSMK